MQPEVWHPVAESGELGDGMLRVVVDGTDWVLARLGGQIVAFADRCPHRRAPLSAGAVEDGEIRCGYHGWRFGAEGGCTLIPANGPDRPVPPRARLRAAPGVVERDGWIWLAG
jgi:phenylpropionate dioxygenase-like ring-hydroxylating dioxygenase large terminal subunit